MLKLTTDPKDFVSAVHSNLTRRRIRFKRYFIILNMLTVLGVLFTTVLAAVMVSKIVYQKYPDWFFFATAGISAMLSLVSSFLNFFVVKDTVEKATIQLNKIEKIMILYSNKLTDKFSGDYAEFNLYNEVSIAMHWISKKQEVLNG